MAAYTEIHKLTDDIDGYYRLGGDERLYTYGKYKMKMKQPE